MSQLIVNGFVTGCIYVMVAVGFSIIYSAMRFFNLSHGAMFLLGAYLTYLFVAILNFSMFWTLLILAPLGATLIHLAIAKAVYFPLRLKNTDSWVVAIVSMGIAIVMEALVGLFFGTRPVGIGGEIVPPVYQLFGLRMTSVDVLICASAFSSVAVVWLFLDRTKLGKAMRATVCDREIAGTVGINTQRVDLLVFSIGAWLAASAGGLMTLQVPLTHTMGNSMLLKAIVVSILGINGGIIGTSVAGLFLGMIENLSVYWFQAGWRDGIALAVLIIYIWSIQVRIRRRRSLMSGGI